MLNLATRWILSPLEQCPSPMVEDWQAEAGMRGCTTAQLDQVTARCHELYPLYDLPVARQYARQWDAPFHGDGCALVYCEMDITHLQAAQKDPRLIIFNSLDDAVPQLSIDAHAHLFDPQAATKPAPSTLRELLALLSARHIKFSFSE